MVVLLAGRGGAGASADSADVPVACGLLRTYELMKLTLKSSTSLASWPLAAALLPVVICFFVDHEVYLGTDTARPCIHTCRSTALEVLLQ